MSQQVAPKPVERLSSDLVGLEFEPVRRTWTDNEVMLYAVGVGARPPKDLDFIYEGRGPKVLPTYAVIPGMAAMGGVGRHVKLPIARMLHGEQSIELFRPIPPMAEVMVRGRIAEIWDKGKAAVIGVEGTAEDADGPMFTVRSSLFWIGGGGFGGERGPSTADVNQPPERAPDIEIEDETRPEQGAIYRLSGDRVALHIDPDFARQAGYKDAFMHGLCTYGFVGRAILAALCDNDPARFKSMTARFADQVWFGDRIITRIWKTAPGEAIVQAVTQDGRIVLSQAGATYTP